MSTTTTLVEPTHLKWDEYRSQINWNLPDSDRWGFRRGMSPVAEMGGLSAFTILLPIGQGSPEAAEATDATFVGARGAVEFIVGDEHYVLAPRDIITIAAGTKFRYQNVDLDMALFYCAIADPEDPGEPAAQAIDHMVWDEYRGRFNWELPMASDWGYHRGSGPHLLTGQLRGHMVSILPGQSTPWHANARDISFFHLQGDVEWNLAGRLWRWDRYDIFTLPKDTAYIYSNIGLEPVLFFDIGTTPPVAGSMSKYYESDPGWPPRPDAVQLETVDGVEGQRRLVRKPT